MITCTHIALQSWVSLFKVLLCVCRFHPHHHRGCTCGSKGSIVPTPTPECFIHRPIGRVLITHTKLCYKWLCYKAQMAVLQSTYIPNRLTYGGATKHMCYKTQMAVLQSTCATKHKCATKHHKCATCISVDISMYIRVPLYFISHK